MFFPGSWRCCFRCGGGCCCYCIGRFTVHIDIKVALRRGGGFENDKIHRLVITKERNKRERERERMCESGGKSKYIIRTTKKRRKKWNTVWHERTRERDIGSLIGLFSIPRRRVSTLCGNPLFPSPPRVWTLSSRWLWAPWRWKPAPPSWPPSWWSETRPWTPSSTEAS